MNENNIPDPEKSEGVNSGPLTDEAKPIDSTAKQPTADNPLTKIEKEMGSFERATLRWSRTAVVISGITGLFILLQWCELSKTLTQMKKQELPHVSLQRITAFNFEAGKEPAFELEFLNSGRSSANDFSADIRFGKVVNPCKNGKLGVEQDVQPYHDSIPMGGYTIAAGQPLRIQLSLGDIMSPSDFESFKNRGIDRGTNLFLIQGQFTYAEMQQPQRYCMAYNGWRDTRPKEWERFEFCDRNYGISISAIGALTASTNLEPMKHSEDQHPCPQPN